MLATDSQPSFSPLYPTHDSQETQGKRLINLVLIEASLCEGDVAPPLIFMTRDPPAD